METLGWIVAVIGVLVLLACPVLIWKEGRDEVREIKARTTCRVMRKDGLHGT